MTYLRVCLCLCDCLRLRRERLLRGSAAATADTRSNSKQTFSSSNTRSNTRQTFSSQQQQHQEQHQTNVQQQQHQEVVNQYVDNRSVTMQLPSSPVPPKPRNRRSRSRTPSRRARVASQSPGALPGAASQRDAGTSVSAEGLLLPTAPLTPGALPFSPGVPETPPFSPEHLTTTTSLQRCRRTCQHSRQAELFRNPRPTTTITNPRPRRSHSKAMPWGVAMLMPPSFRRLWLFLRLLLLLQRGAAKTPTHLLHYYLRRGLPTPCARPGPTASTLTTSARASCPRTSMVTTCRFPSCARAFTTLTSRATPAQRR